jgi:chemotaxis protein MotB
MTSTKPRQALPSFATFAALAAMVAGCCGDLEAKNAECESLTTSLTTELSGLRSRVATMEELQKKLADAEGQMAELKVKEQLAEQRLETLKGVIERLKGVIESGDLTVRIKRGRMVLELPSAILFASGEAELSDKGQETLDKVAAVLKEIKDREFQVAGHTDNVPLGNDSAYGSNWHLSAARSVAVVQYLIEQGVRPKNLSAAGYSQYRPVARNSTAKGKAKNRRISIALMPNLKELPDLTSLEAELGLKEPEVAY